MAGDIPLENTKPVEKPLLLTGYASMDVSQAPVASKVLVLQGGISVDVRAEATKVSGDSAPTQGLCGFIQECYSPPTREAVGTGCGEGHVGKSRESLEQFKARVESSKPDDYCDILSSQLKAIEKLHVQFEDSISRGGQYQRPCDLDYLAKRVNCLSGKLDATAKATELRKPQMDGSSDYRLNGFEIQSDSNTPLKVISNGSTTVFYDGKTISSISKNKNGDTIVTVDGKETVIPAKNDTGVYKIVDGKPQIVDGSSLPEGTKSQLVSTNPERSIVMANTDTMKPLTTSQSAAAINQISQEKLASLNGKVQEALKSGCGGSDSGNSNKPNDGSAPSTPWKFPIGQDNIAFNQPKGGSSSSDTLTRDTYTDRLTTPSPGSRTAQAESRSAESSLSKQSEMARGGQSNQIADRPNLASQRSFDRSYDLNAGRTNDRPLSSSGAEASKFQQYLANNAARPAANQDAKTVGPVLPGRIEQAVQAPSVLGRSAIPSDIKTSPLLQNALQQNLYRSLQNPLTPLLKQTLQPLPTNPMVNKFPIGQQPSNYYAKPTINQPFSPMQSAFASPYSAMFKPGLGQLAQAPLKLDLKGSDLLANHRLGIGKGFTADSKVGGTPLIHPPGKLPNFIGDKVTGGHFNPIDKWNPIKGLSDGRVGGGGTGPWVPLVGKLPGVGVGSGRIPEGVKGAGSTRGDGKFISEGKFTGDGKLAGSKDVKVAAGVKAPEGIKQGGNEVAGGKGGGTNVSIENGIKNAGIKSDAIKNDGIKQDGTKHDGSRIEGIKSPGVRSGDGASVGQANLGGKKIEGVKIPDGPAIIDAVGIANFIQNLAGLEGIRIAAGQGVDGRSNGRITKETDSKEDKTQNDRQVVDSNLGQTEPKSPVYKTSRVKYTVKNGDSLSAIAIRHLGDERFADLIRIINPSTVVETSVSGRNLVHVISGSQIWLPSDRELDRYAKLMDIKAGVRSKAVGFPV